MTKMKMLLVRGMLMCCLLVSVVHAQDPVKLHQGLLWRIASAGSQAFFIADDTTHSVQLWRTDGTTQGTHMLTGKPGRFYSDSLAVDSQGRAFFSYPSTLTTPPWVSDGTPAGTKKIVETLPGNVGVGPVITLKSKAYFGLTGTKKGLLVTDGTAAGTQILKQFDETTLSSKFFFLGTSDQYLFFVFYEPKLNPPMELWRSDGTVSGTIRLAGFPYISNPDIVGSLAINKNHCTSHGENFYFPLYINIDHQNWWCTDGTSEGTRQITSTTPSYIRFLVNRPVYFRDRLYYIGIDVNRHSTLYECNGSTSGTASIAKLSNTPVLNTLFSDATDKYMIFHVANKTFISDGTVQGTRQLALASSGSVDEQYQFVRVPRKPVWFCAGSDSIHGIELWMTDGTDAGTKMVADVVPGKSSSDPRNLVLCGDDVVFEDKNHMLWSVPMPPLPNAARGWNAYR